MMYKLLSKLESFFLTRVKLENKYPPLFIVGPPRSGTTLIYLYLINKLQLGYFPNISKNHPRACVSYAIIGKLFHRYRATYNNSFGIVEGAMSPSDGWEIFHRWFPRYDYTKSVELDDLFELRNVVRLFESIFHAPFANKNNSNSVRIKYLSRLFPGAIFIHVMRDIESSVMSLLESRQKHNIKIDEWWGVPPPQFADMKFSKELKRAVCQIWGVNAFIQSSLSQLQAENWYSVSYEHFCERPQDLMEWLSSAYTNAGITLGSRSLSLGQGFQARHRTCPSDLKQSIRSIITILENT